MQLDTLVIEATRRCTQMCGHCLRGDAEDCDMANSMLQRLFEQLDANQVDYINQITISGGEPLLNPDVIDECVRLMELHQIRCGGFYIATGAHNIPWDKVKKSIASIANLYAYCDDNEITAVNISNDEFHINDDNIVKMLKAFTFTSERDSNMRSDDKWLIPEGRLDGDSYYQGKARMFALPEHIEYGYSIYFNVNGDLIPGCDFSYEHQAKIAKYNVVQTDDAVENYIKYIKSLMKRAKQKSA